MFYMYVFFRVTNWPKIGIFLGLGFISTFGSPPPRHIFPGVPTLGNAVTSFRVFRITFGRGRVNTRLSAPSGWALIRGLALI